MLIVGLGNPGDKYQKTYHNMGYGVVDALAKKIGKKIDKIECSSLTMVTQILGKKIIVAKPLTFMNNSGIAVKSLVAKYGEDAKDLLVCFDDFDLEKFSVRIRERGSAGTHNGMKSVIAEMKTDEIKRLRVGTGSPENNIIDFVLSTPSKEDCKNFEEVFDFCAEKILEYIANDDFNKFMREGNIKHNATISNRE